MAPTTPTAQVAKHVGAVELAAARALQESAASAWAASDRARELAEAQRSLQGLAAKAMHERASVEAGRAKAEADLGAMEAELRRTRAAGDRLARELSGAQQRAQEAEARAVKAERRAGAAEDEATAARAAAAEARAFFCWAVVSVLSRSPFLRSPLAVSPTPSFQTPRRRAQGHPPWLQLHSAPSAPEGPGTPSWAAVTW